MQVIKLFGLILISLSALSGCVSTSVQNTNWEYKVVTVDYLNEKTKEFLEATPFKLERDDGMPIQSKDYSDRVSSTLNSLGEDGWELIHVNGNTFVLKRVK